VFWAHFDPHSSTEAVGRESARVVGSCSEGEQVDYRRVRWGRRRRSHPRERCQLPSARRTASTAAARLASTRTCSAAELIDFRPHRSTYE